MDRLEFIGFLKAKEIELNNTSHWQQSFKETENHWTLYRPSVDWLEDTMELTIEGMVKINYSESFYDDPKFIEMTYKEFVENYSKSVGCI